MVAELRAMGHAVDVVSPDQFPTFPLPTYPEIKLALESIFAEDGVKIEKVNTVRTLGKIKRQGKFSGRTPEIKKAYVTLKKDSKPIKFFEGMAQ